MSDISCANLKSLEKAITEQKEFWFVSYDDIIFKSKISKLFCNAHSKMMLSVRDEEMANNIEGNKYLNAHHLLPIYRCFTSENDAKKYKEQTTKNQ